MLRSSAPAILCWLALVAVARADPPPPPKDAGDRLPIGNTPPIGATPDGLTFGSYGRVGVGMDGAVHEGYPVNVVAHGSRLEETPYLEIYLFYTGRVGDQARWRVVVTPAFGGDLFHYTGSFSSHVAVRNAYAEVADLGVPGLRFWAGSRMYRGDDIYLLDWWPLDNLNTVGGGAGYRRGRWDAQIHAGLNRIDDPFAFQSLAVPARALGPVGQAVVLDRPRVVVSGRLAFHLGRAGGEAGGKVVAYGEVHAMGSGDRVFQTQMRTQHLPADQGFVVGLELAGRLHPTTFLNLFVKYAGGLAAYGELAAPNSFDAAGTTAHARDFTLALSGNAETRRVGVMLGAYYRRFTDADPTALNPLDYAEGIVVTRPHVYLTRWLHLAVELSYQARQYGGFDPLLGRRLTPQVFRASLMPIVSPTGPGTYARPQIYLLATVSTLNADARAALFDPSDIRYPTGTVLYFGIGAEWWFQNLVSL
jgi:maltoporin